MPNRVEPSTLPWGDDVLHLPGDPVYEEGVCIEHRLREEEHERCATCGMGPAEFGGPLILCPEDSEDSYRPGSYGVCPPCFREQYIARYLQGKRRIVTRVPSAQLRIGPLGRIGSLRGE